MGLGIVLHAALAFIGIPWVVQDEQVIPGLGLVVSAIHGFRMPLFFLLSGFFTAMLWRRRGTRGMLVQRARRLGLPLALGCLTIVPLMWGVIAAAGAAHATFGATSGDDAPNTAETSSDSAIDTAANTDVGLDTSRDLWTAAAFGDVAAVTRWLNDENDDSVAPDALDPVFGVTALGWATMTNQPNVIAVLLENGADPSARYRDQNTPLHSAAFFGRAACAEALLVAGAALDAENQQGETPWGSLRHDAGTTEFIASLVGVPIDFATVSSGRADVEQLFTAHSDGARPSAMTARPLKRLIQTLVWIPVFHHLWFLWFLVWLIAIFTVIARWTPRVRLPAWLVTSPICLVVLVPVTLLTQVFMHFGGAMPGFGPDTSAGLLPMPHVLAHYATYFFFGALVYVTPGASDRIGRGWWWMLPLAVAILPVALACALHLPWGTKLSGGDPTVRFRIASVGQVLYAWLMIFGLIGLCAVTLRRDRPWVRYVSDASYWAYLIHLPLLIIGQAALRAAPIPGLIKLLLLLGSITVIVFVSYATVVRYTWIGRLLNGPRVRTAVRQTSRT